jgi:hypothetical protein
MLEQQHNFRVGIEADFAYTIEHDIMNRKIERKHLSI